jgi:hypothetical protein
VKLPDRALRIALATVLTLSGVRLLELPGTTVILPAVVALGLILLVRSLRGKPAEQGLSVPA